MTAETDKIKFHPNWMRFMYAVTAVAAGIFGIGFLAAPDSMLSTMGYPAQEPVIAGVLYSLWLAIGIWSIAGLRSPLKFTPVLLLAMTYKTVWIIAIVIPRAIAGTLPSFAMVTAVQWVLFIVGYLIVIPWRYLFAK